MYSYGVARLPVSMSSLIVASQLVFTAAPAFLLVGQRFTAFSVNAVVLLSVGAAVSATTVCTDGMAVNHDFQAIAREAKEFGLGETNYYLVMVGSIIIWQCFFFGMIGLIFYSTSPLSVVIIRAKSK
ncbi:Purine permease 2 [Striga hermonthica]|uniref:Purine permease 2 n=1 Tax=Striga hermonthica TaxID=68872 RepID=A0A9N7NVI2_STRHE|nr:Purine permease 2 [Striga hermonthica]